MNHFNNYLIFHVIYFHLVIADINSCLIKNSFFDEVKIILIYNLKNYGFMFFFKNILTIKLSKLALLIINNTLNTHKIYFYRINKIEFNFFL